MSPVVLMVEMLAKHLGPAFYSCSAPSGLGLPVH